MLTEKTLQLGLCPCRLSCCVISQVDSVQMPQGGSPDHLSLPDACHIVP